MAKEQEMMKEWDMSFQYITDSAAELAEQLKKQLESFSKIRILFSNVSETKAKVKNAMVLAGWRLDSDNGDHGIYYC